MDSSIRQIITVLTGFVDNTLIPLLQSNRTQQSRALQSWVQLKSFLSDMESVDIRKIETFVSQLTTPTIAKDYKRITYDIFDRSPNNNNIYSSLLEDSWKYRVSEPLQADGERRDENGGEDKAKLKGEAVNIESFENLLYSFRKLCVNFENNHKKLREASSS